MKPVIVNSISKFYGREKLAAVNDISFDVNRGEIFGLIGPDGAGKTSVFRMLTSLLLPDSGTATVEGFDVAKDYKNIRKRVGYMPGKFSLYQDLTVKENLSFFATLFSTTIEQNYDLIKDVYIQIEPFRDRRAGKLSGGMKQKLALCCALIHKPAVLFLDEPTTGVDPVSRKEFWDMLQRLRMQHITILVSTPYMDEAALCDRIALMQSGKILTIDTPANISAAYPEPLYAIGAGNMFALLQALQRFQGTITSYAFGAVAHATFKTGTTIDDLKSHLHESGIQYIDVRRTDATIEDRFIQLLKN